MHNSIFVKLIDILELAYIIFYYSYSIVNLGQKLVNLLKVIRTYY